MADNTATITFNNDLFTDARGDKATYTGTIQVDYTTNRYSGKVQINGSGLGAGIGLSGALSTNGSTYSIAQSNFYFSFTGQQPTTASAEFVANNNEDYKTSLNPAGQQNQPVSTSGGSSAGGGTSGGGTSGGGTSGGGTGSSGGGDRTATISFTNDLFTDARGDRATYTGSFNVDYTTGTYSGKVKVKGNGLGAGLGISGHLAVSGNTYTIRGANFTLSYTGQQPTTAAAEFVANNNEDYRTSLNPAGQRQQPVTSSGNGTATTAARVASVSTAPSEAADDAGPASNFVGSRGTADTFVFDPGHGHDVVRQFQAAGARHDTLSLSGADYGNAIAAVLRHTTDTKGGALIRDPKTGDTVLLAGVDKAELVEHRHDFAFHA